MADDPSRSGSGSPTIYSVAERAGVSIATVSRVLKDRDSATPAVRDRVLLAVEELDWVPRQSARSLAEGAHRAFGIIVGDLVGAYFPNLVIGFEASAGDGSRSVVLQVTVHRNEPVLAARGLLSRVDGLAVGPCSLPDAAIRRLAKQVPVVLVGRRPIDGLDAVITESSTSAATVARHLIEHGRRRLLFAGALDGTLDATERFEGASSAVREAGLEWLTPRISPQTEQAGAAVAEHLASLPPAERPDAVVCGNDELALALVQRLGRLGVRVPDDIAVTGWDDVHAARYLSPGLTTVRQPVDRLGRVAAELLARRLATPSAAPTVQRLPTTPVLRESCGCAHEQDGTAR